MVPLPRFGQIRALGSLNAQQVSFLSLGEIDLVAVGPGLSFTGRLATDVNAGIPVRLLLGPPIDVEHEVAIGQIAADKSISALEHQYSILYAHFAAGYLPSI